MLSALSEDAKIIYKIFGLERGFSTVEIE